MVIMAGQTLEAHVLIGWYDRDAAVRFLTTDCVFDPPMNDGDAEARWRPYRDRVENLAERPGLAPHPLPLTASERSACDQFLKSRSGAPNIKDVIKIDPSGLVVHQLIVCDERRVAYQNAVATMQGWINVTLAAPQTSHQVQLGFGPNGMDAHVPHGEFVITFSNTGYQIAELAKFVSVTKFDQRMLLHAGYHRSYARMRGMAPDAIERSVLVVVTTDGDFLVSPSSPNQGVRAMCCGLRPPLFTDFFDDRFFMTVPLKRKRFVLQVRAQMVPVDA